MSKRLKRVYSTSSQVYHLWANQTQSDARSSFRASFAGTSAYSYRTEVARIVVYKGVRLAVVSSQKYSNTTSKHQSELVNSVHGLMFYVRSSDLTDVRKGLLETQDAIITRLFDVFNKSAFYGTTKEDVSWRLGLENIEEFNRTARALGHPELTVEVPQEFIDLTIEHVKGCKDREKQLQSPEALAKKDALALKRQEKELQKNAEDIQKWRTGAISATQFISNLNPQLLRLRHSSEGWFIQTSRGAIVPIQAGAKLFRAIDAGWKVNGHKIGDFTVTGYDKTTGIVSIGCHRIHIDEARAVLGKDKKGEAA